MQFTTEDKLILSCIKIHPSTIELEQINNLIPEVQDWNYLITTIIDRGIGPLFFKKLPLLSNSLLIPVSVKTKLQQVYYKTFSRSTVLYEHFRKVAEAFTLYNIPIIALKGIYLSEWLYQDIGLRQFSDIDLLVKEEEGLKCINILTELGYKPFDSKETDFVKAQAEIIHYEPMILNGVSIEIHIKLHRITEKYHLPINELWNSAIPVTINNVPIFALRTTDLLIHLCIHLDKHFREGHVQFTCFNDITNLLDKLIETMDWNTLTETCLQYNCVDIIFGYIVLVNKYMNAPVPEDIIQKYRLLLTEKDEQLFLKYLNGYKLIGFANAVPTHFESIKKLKTLSHKFRYIWDILYPPKDFMIQKYNINDKRLVISDKQKLIHRLPWWFWYPYRWWIGVKGVFKVISGK